MNNLKLYRMLNLLGVIVMIGALICMWALSSMSIMEEYHIPEPKIEQIPEEISNDPMPMSIHQLDYAAELFKMAQNDVLDSQAGKPSSDIKDDDLSLLAKVVHAEAGNQDEIGKRLVVDVLLNRVDSLMFPNSIPEVVRQEGQFKIADSYTQDDMDAVKGEIDNRTDADILWFRTSKYHSFGIPAYQYGDHYFSANR